MSSPQAHDCGSFHSLSWAYETYLQHDRTEQSHWEDICRSYRQYAAFALNQWINHQQRLHALPESQRELLPPGLRRGSPEYEQRTAEFKEAVIRNQFCLDSILRHAGQPHSQEQSVHQGYASDLELSKVSSVLKSLARDWSLDGRAEREMAYAPIREQIKKYLPLPNEGKPPRVCVPGAGVGRLAYDLRAMGYSVQGNEFSLPMLLASDFILNGAAGASPSRPLRISPYLLETRNVHYSGDPCRVVEIPDVDPYAIIEEHDVGDSTAEFSMAAGEFVSIYNTPREKGQWDAVVCCFFLDASPCVVEYIQVIHHMLKPGGIIVNFGPLLWHWSGPAMRLEDKGVADYQKRYSHLDKKYLTSVDLSWGDVRHVLVSAGFDIIEERVGVEALYTSDHRSMMSMKYRCVNFVAKKRTEHIDDKQNKCIEEKKDQRNESTVDSQMPYENFEETQTISGGSNEEEMEIN